MFAILRALNMTRTKWKRESTTNAIMYGLALLILVIILHTISMMAFEGMDFSDALWLTVVTLSTVGYGDYSAKTDLGRLSTFVLCIAFGIFLLGKVGGEFLDSRLQKMALKQKGQWRFKLRNHILIIGDPSLNGQAARYFETVCAQIRKIRDYDDSMIMLCGTSFASGDGLPNSLSEMGCVHYVADLGEWTKIQECSPQEASVIIILSNTTLGLVADSVTADLIYRLREMCGNSKQIVAECQDDTNRARLLKAGASVVLRPVRAYPEMLVQAMRTPDSVEVIEDIITVDGNTCVGRLVEIESVWSDYVMHSVINDRGIPLGYKRAEGDCYDRNSFVLNPRADTVLKKGDTVFVLYSSEGMA